MEKTDRLRSVVYLECFDSKLLLVLLRILLIKRSDLGHLVAGCWRLGWHWSGCCCCLREVDVVPDVAVVRYGFVVYERLLLFRMLLLFTRGWCWSTWVCCWSRRHSCWRRRASRCCRPGEEKTEIYLKIILRFNQLIRYFNCLSFFCQHYNVYFLDLSKNTDDFRNPNKWNYIHNRY